MKTMGCVMAASMKSLAADQSVAGVKKTDLYRVDPRLLREEDGFNLRDYDDPDVDANIQAFADSFAAGKPVPPLIVRCTSDGDVYVVEGHCRRLGALRAIEQGVPLAYVDVVQFKGNDAERIEVMLRSAEGLRLKPLEVALGYLRLQRLGLSVAEIAKAVGRGSQQRVEQLLILATADRAIQDMVRLGKVAADVAIGVIREHRENASAVLAALLDKATSTGAKRVTAGVVHGPSYSRKVVSRVVTGVNGLLNSLDDSLRDELLSNSALDANRQVTVSAAALRDLLMAQGDILAADEKVAAKGAASATDKE